jgi:hypothetical protein
MRAAAGRDERHHMAPQIVWRIPGPVRHRQRWELVRRLPSSTVYLIQELVSVGDYSFWCAKPSLELVRARRRSIAPTNSVTPADTARRRAQAYK